MPMPPPKPSTEGKRDRQVQSEVRQITRALHAEGSQSPEALEKLVGSAYWEDGRYEQAIAFAIAHGHVVRTAEGRLAAT
jgi:hypothetical protein